MHSFFYFKSITMIKKIQFFILLLFISSTILSQDNNPPLSTCGHPVAHDNCFQAPTPSLCELDGYTINTDGFTVDNDPVEAYTNQFCGPNTGTHNDMWISFTAQENTIHLFFDNHGCQSTSSCRGVQAGIFETDCKTGATYCNTLTCVNCITTSFDLMYNGLTPGHLYYIMLDGCCNDVCEYTINVLEGLPDANFTVTLPSSSELCYEDPDFFNTTLYAITTPSNEDYTYEWTTDDGHIVGATDSMNIEIDTFGTYTVTVRETINCCKAEMSTSITLSKTSPHAIATIPDTLDASTPSVTLTGDFTYQKEGSYEYSWLYSNGEIIPNGENQLSVEVTTPGDYTFSVYEKSTYCMDTETVTVHQTTDLLNFESKNQISITPNPAKEWITFKAQQNIQSIEIIDIYGKVVAIFYPKNKLAEYDIQALSNGIYFAKTLIAGEISVKKFQVTF